MGTRFALLALLIVATTILPARTLALTWEVCTSDCERCAADRIQPCESCIGKDADGYTYIKWWCGACDYMC